MGKTRETERKHTFFDQWNFLYFGDLFSVPTNSLIVSNKWEQVAPLKTSRDGVGVAILSDKIYAVGGFDRAYLNSVECYDPRVSPKPWVLDYISFKFSSCLVYLKLYILPPLSKYIIHNIEQK